MGALSFKYAAIQHFSTTNADHASDPCCPQISYDPMTWLKPGTKGPLCFYSMIPPSPLEFETNKNLSMIMKVYTATYQREVSLFYKNLIKLYKFHQC